MTTLDDIVVVGNILNSVASIFCGNYNVVLFGLGRTTLEGLKMNITVTIPTQPAIGLEVINHSLIQSTIVRFIVNGAVVDFIHVEGAGDPKTQLAEILASLGQPTLDGQLWLQTTSKEEVLRVLMPWIRNFVAILVARINKVLGKTETTGPTPSVEYYDGPVDLFIDIVKRIKFTVNPNGSVSGSI